MTARSNAPPMRVCSSEEQRAGDACRRLSFDDDHLLKQLKLGGQLVLHAFADLLGESRTIIVVGGVAADRNRKLAEFGVYQRHQTRGLLAQLLSGRRPISTRHGSTPATHRAALHSRAAMHARLRSG